MKQRNTITRKFLDNLNNLNRFRGRHQTVKIHVQEELHTHIFQCGAGVHENDKPPVTARRPGGWFRDFSFLRFNAGFLGDFPSRHEITAETVENGGRGGGYTVERRRWYFPHNKKQARLSSNRACYFSSKYLEKSYITLDISDNSFISYSFSAFIIRAISKSRSVAGELPLILFFSAEAPSR